MTLLSAIVHLITEDVLDFWNKLFSIHDFFLFVVLKLILSKFVERLFIFTRSAYPVDLYFTSKKPFTRVDFVKHFRTTVDKIPEVLVSHFKLYKNLRRLF